MNHGKGLAGATENTAGRARELLTEMKAWEKFTGHKIERQAILNQVDLFPE